MDASPPPPPVTPKPPVDLAEDIAKNKDLAALSYFWILSLVVYFAKADSPFARFHARQGLTLFILSIVFAFVPVFRPILELLVLAGCVVGFLNAAQGKQENLPLVAALSHFDWTQLRADWKTAVGAIERLWKSTSRPAAKEPPSPSPQPPQPPSPPPAPPSPPTA